MANWIAKAVANKGGLHRSLGIAAGKKIPAKAISKAMKSDSPKIAKQASFAKTLSSFKKK
jgi:hypothetical protein